MNDNDMQKQIGVRIRRRRQQLDLTQEQLAEKLGYKSKSSINKIELGERNLTQRKIKELADQLNTTPAYVMGWEDAEPAPVEDSYTEEELELIRVYRSLNEEGRSFVEQVKKLLRSSPQYYKEDEEKEKTEG